MDINIAPIKNYEGKEIPINCEVNIAGMPGDDFKILEPVKILGVILEELLNSKQKARQSFSLSVTDVRKSSQAR